MAGTKGHSGRKSKSYNTAQVQKTMEVAAVHAASLIKDFIKGKDSKGNKVSITMVKLTACLQAIAHGIGLPRQKLDIHHTGEQMSLKDLAMLAQSGESLVQNANKSGAKPLQNDVGSEEEVINVPTKPMKQTIKTSKN